MRTLRVALAQVDPTVGDIDNNARLVRDGIERARAADADVVAFPELVLTGYPPEDLVLKQSFVAANEHALTKIAGEVEGICAVVGFVHHSGELFNAAAVCADGEVRGVYEKHYLPTAPSGGAGVFDEDRVFKRGSGSPVFVVTGTRVGISICEDIWYPSGPAEWESRAGAEVIININGSPYRAGVDATRRQMLATRASDYVVALAYVNTVGGQDELVFDGRSLVYDHGGRLVASGPAFESDLLVIDIDAEAIERARLNNPRLRKLSAPPAGEQTPEIFVSGEIASRADRVAGRLAPEMDPDEEIYRALVCGTRDYVDKNRITEVFVAISGGIDSALTLAIAVDALGADRVTGVVMSSKYSSSHSREDAFDLATRLGVKALDLPIEGPHGALEDALRDHIEALPGRDLAEQNIQSRIRGMYVLALSNARPGSIVLTTGNKSELATGYATLYGDMAGGFSVLKDVPKTLVYRLARWRNRSDEVIPERTIDKPPSAELKPGQLDADSLPAYDVLDAILEAYVEGDRSVDDIAAMGFDRDIVVQTVRRVDRNEYKRRQAPPGPKVTSKAFGRDRRLPITNRFVDG